MQELDVRDVLRCGRAVVARMRARWSVMRSRFPDRRYVRSSMRCCQRGGMRFVSCARCVADTLGARFARAWIRQSDTRCAPVVAARMRRWMVTASRQRCVQVRRYAACNARASRKLLRRRAMRMPSCKAQLDRYAWIRWYLHAVRFWYVCLYDCARQLTVAQTGYARMYACRPYDGEFAVCRARRYAIPSDRAAARRRMRRMRRSYVVDMDNQTAMPQFSVRMLHAVAVTSLRVCVCMRACGYASWI